MNQETIMNQIKATLEEITDIPQSEMDADSAFMDDLEVSSLEIMMMIADLEEHFKIKVPSRDLRQIITIADLADYIEGRIVK